METLVFYSAGGCTIGVDKASGGLDLITHNNLTIMADPDEPSGALIGLTMFESILELSRSGTHSSTLFDQDPDNTGTISIGADELFEPALATLCLPMLSTCGKIVVPVDLGTRDRSKGDPGKVNGKQIEKYIEVISDLPEAVEALMLRCNTISGAKVEESTWGSEHPRGLIEGLGANRKDLAASWQLIERLCRSSVRSARKLLWSLKSNDLRAINASISITGTTIIADYETIKGLLVDFIALATPAFGLDLCLKTHMKSSASWYVSSDIVEDLQARLELMSITLGELAAVDLQLISSLKWTLDRIKNV